MAIVLVEDCYRREILQVYLVFMWAKRVILSRRKKFRGI